MPKNLILRSVVGVGLCLLAGGAAASSSPPTAAVTAAESDREWHKRLITVFYEETFRQRSTAMIYHAMVPDLIQHDPKIEDGRAGFLKYHEHLLTTYPRYSNEIRRIASDGNLVTVHVLERLNPWDRGNVQIHMYRISSLGIVEHWVVGNPIPATSLNANGLI